MIGFELGFSWSRRVALMLLKAPLAPSGFGTKVRDLRNEKGRPYRLSVRYMT